MLVQRISSYFSLKTKCKIDSFKICFEKLLNVCYIRYCRYSDNVHCQRAYVSTCTIIYVLGLMTTHFLIHFFRFSPQIIACSCKTFQMCLHVLNFSKKSNCKILVICSAIKVLETSMWIWDNDVKAQHVRKRLMIAENVRKRMCVDSYEYLKDIFKFCCIITQPKIMKFHIMIFQISNDILYSSLPIYIHASWLFIL